jgi:membrane protein YdbS with pleckstrin-like domain
MHATASGIPVIGKDFAPSDRLRPYYYLVLVLVVLLGFCTWYIPLLFIGEPVIAALFGIPLLVIVIVWAAWIPLYCRKIVYRFTGDEITWRRGVWFRRTGIVPYSRITNVDIVQGPVMRRFGIFSLRIQTAGYSAQAQSEISIEGMTAPEEVRELIMGYVRGSKAAGDATGAEAAPVPADAAILAELRSIRMLLEAQGKR